MIVASTSIRTIDHNLHEKRLSGVSGAVWDLNPGIDPIAFPATSAVHLPVLWSRIGKNICKLPLPKFRSDSVGISDSGKVPTLW
jgi:hypothetical protein